MSEFQEGVGQLGRLIRHPDGTPIVIEREDTQYEVDPKRHERRPSRESVTPRFNQDLARGTLVEIPGEGGGFFRVSNPMPGQEKPNSVFVEPISKSEFQKEQRKGRPVAMPDNV